MSQGSAAAHPPASWQRLRQIARRVPGLRSAWRGINAWRLSGWSARWLVLRTPLLGSFAWKLYGVLTAREFRQRLQADLANLAVAQQQLVDRQQQAAQQLQQQSQDTASRFESFQQQLADQDSRLAQRLVDESSRLQERQERFRVETYRQLRELSLGRSVPSPLFAEWYTRIEQSCRGDEAAIEQRLAHYLPFLEAAGAGRPGAPVLDLGCGRGEWLALLARRQLEALGVDNNHAMLAAARQQNLHVVEGDLIEFLHQTDAASLGAVTAFQVVEHLDQGALLELFQQAHRVLKPGGLLLLETPNPENLQVAAYSFWQDPTHVRPLPPPLLAYTAAHFGYDDIRIERTSPWSADLQLQDGSAAARHLEKLLFCAQDYALIARKPHAQ